MALPHEHAAQTAWARFWWKAHRAAQPAYPHGPLGRWLCRVTQRLAAPAGAAALAAGREDFDYPGTCLIPRLAESRPDVIHLHNLHTRYFDLRALPRLSQQAPLLLTLHDAWTMTGGCAHSLGCERWRHGCGQCPHLDVYPARRCDATAENWREKRDIFAQTRLTLVAPCRWLIERAAASLLAPAIVERHVIPHGVDLACFRPGERLAARAALDLPPHAHVLLFVANGIRRNPFKDFATLEAAFERLAAERSAGQATPNCEPDRPLLLLAVGEAGPARRLGSHEIRFVASQTEPAALVSYYRAADIYVHAAHEDTFPNTVLEALACGCAVVATAVGGISEQVREETGVLVPPRNAEALAAEINGLLEYSARRQALAAVAARDAAKRFDFDRTVSAYLALYEAMLTRAPAATVVALRSGGAATVRE